MQPNTILANIAPTDSSDVIQDASSIVIFPLGNGDASDVNRTFIGLDHPSNNPNPTMYRFTEENENKIKIKIENYS